MWQKFRPVSLIYIKVLSPDFSPFPPPSGFETLQKAFIKAKAVVEKEGTTPTFYIRALVEMEDFISQVKMVESVSDISANGCMPWGPRIPYTCV